MFPTQFDQVVAHHAIDVAVCGDGAIAQVNRPRANIGTQLHMVRDEHYCFAGLGDGPDSVEALLLVCGVTDGEDLIDDEHFRIEVGRDRER